MANGLQRGNDIRAVVHTCPSDCKEAYQQVLDEVERVKDASDPIVRFEPLGLKFPTFGTDPMQEMRDIIYRNSIINDKYAQLYRDMPENRWAGLASIVSSQMGCNMHLLAANVMEPIANFFIGELPRFGGLESIHALGEGNLAIFEQVYPPLRMAATCGKKKFLECVEKGEITPRDELVKAIRQFDDGYTDAAIETIVNFEQNTVAQPVYDNNRSAFGFMREAAAWAKKVGVDVESIPLSTRCGAGGRIPFNTADDPGNLSLADDRIRYFWKLNSLWNGHLD